MTVGEQDRDGLEPVLAQQLLDAFRRVLARVDDHALLAGGGRDDVTIGLEGPCGEACDEHLPQVISSKSQWECNRRVPVRVAGLRIITRWPIRFAHLS